MSDRTVSMAEVNKKLTRGADLKDDALLMMEPYNNWEEKIMPAPYAIAILGQLIVISSMSDFPLTAPKDGFKYVQWPDSFRASLAQVSGEGYKAFNLAHNAMDEIKNATNMVPNFMKDAVSILIQGSDFDVKETLPVVLENIEGIAIVCKERSEGVAKKFEHVMNIILELQQSCVQTKSVSEKELKRLRLQITQQKQKQEQLEDNNKRFKEQYDKVNANLEKYTKEYDKAMKEVPSGGDLLLYNFVDACTNVISGVTSILTFGMGGSSQQTEGSSSSKNKQDEKHQQPKTESYTTFEDHALYDIGARLSKPVDDLSLFFDGNNKLKKILINGHLEKTLNAQMFCLESILDDAKSQHSSNPLRQDILNVCKEAIKCYKDIENGEYVDTSKLKEKVAVVSAQAMRINTQCSTAVNRDLLQNDPPLKRSKYKSNAGMSTAQQAIKNAHFKIDAASQRLAEVEKNFAAAQDNMLKNSEELTKALNKITEFNAAEATTKDVIEVLRNGINQLGKLQEQWSQLSQFFDQIANLIKTNLKTNLNTFIQYTDKGRNTRLEGYTVSQGMRNIIYKTTFEAVKYSYLVNHLSSGYFQVSDKYLMNSVSSLGNLLSIESPNEIQRAQLELTNNCENTVQEIKMLIQGHAKEFKRRISNRMDAIKTEYDAVLPPISNEDRNEVQTMIKQGISQAPKREVAKGVELDMDDYC